MYLALKILASGLLLSGSYLLLVYLAIAANAGLFAYMVLLAGLIGGFPWNFFIFLAFLQFSHKESFGLNEFFVSIGSFGTSAPDWAWFFGFIVFSACISMFISGTLVGYAYFQYKPNKKHR